MDLLQEVSDSKFVLVLLDEKQYENKLATIVKKIEKKSIGKICYVCLSKPYTHVIEDLKTAGIDTTKFFFIDVLSSHYKKPEQVDNCIFIENPGNVIELQKAIANVVVEHQCDYILFDTISSLLMYEQEHNIVRMGHEFTIKSENRETNKIFIVLKEKGSLQPYTDVLVKDMSMFADKTLELKET